MIMIIESSPRSRPNVEGVLEFQVCHRANRPLPTPDRWRGCQGHDPLPFALAFGGSIRAGIALD